MNLSRTMRAAAMLKQIGRLLATPLKRNFSISARNNFKVTVCGAGGGVGQPLSLLLKLNPLITELSCYDVMPTIPGIGLDLSHIDTESDVVGLLGPENLVQAINRAHIVVIAAGVARKPGMERDDLFDANAGIVKQIAEVIAKVSPQSLIAVVTNPVNSLVPICAEVLKKHGVFDPKRVFGVTSLDVVRANTFIGDVLGVDPKQVKIPVIGGHSGVTIIPLLSNCEPEIDLEEEEVDKLTKRIQEAGTEVLNGKGGAGSATLSTAYACANFVHSLVGALDGQPNIVECSYVESNVTEATYFSTPLLLGRDGMKENMGLPKLNAYETKLLVNAIPVLNKDIQKAIDFVKKESAEPAEQVMEEKQRKSAQK